MGASSPEPQERQASGFRGISVASPADRPKVWLTGLTATGEGSGTGQLPVVFLQLLGSKPVLPGHALPQAGR